MFSLELWILLMSSLHLVVLLVLQTFLMLIFLAFFTNQMMGMSFSNSLLEFIDSFVMFPMTAIVVSYIVPGFEPFAHFFFGEGSMTIITIRGQQWFWNYMTEINDWEDFSNNSKQVDGLFLHQSFLPLYIPVFYPSLMIGDSSDVMHSWGAPNLGVKMDVMPGHLTLETFVPMVSGMFTGYCYELCGVYHSLMSMNLIVY